MLTVIGCVADQHDIRFVALAALICILASYAAIDLLHEARSSEGRTRAFWVAVAALASGSGIWATHFVAMLAYKSGVPSGYDLGLTALSLVAAILLTGAGLTIALPANRRGAAWLGGAVIGGGIAAMHYTGMAAFQVAGAIRWDAGLVVASIVFGVAAGAAALPLGLRRRAVTQQALGALVLTIAICAHHFTAMAAVTIAPDPRIAVSESAAPHEWVAAIVALASLSILFLVLVALVLESRERRRLERARLVNNLANAAVEGILICEGDRIVTVNDSMAGLLGRSPESLVGAALSEVAPPLAAAAGSYQARDVDLVSAAGELIAAEAIEHTIEVGGRPHRAIAVRDLRARRQAERRIHFLAHHDGLTGLANRASFNDRLDAAIADALATQRPVAVLCLDLDRFKEVNDQHGHAVGDALLQTFAVCVGRVLDEDELFARLGGDEFAVVAPVADLMAAERLAERILAALSCEDTAPGVGLRLSTSIGIALCPTDAVDREALLSCADTALYRAKLEGRADFKVFQPRMGVEEREKRKLEQDLRGAWDRGELRLVYQPQVDIASGRVVGFESLLRWRHPVRGDVPPDVFVPIAEAAGSILNIGEWVLFEACREAATWTEPLRIAVNVSAVQLHSKEFPRRAREVLAKTGLDPARLELEITETALIRDLDRAVVALRQLKALGARIAMDDFGTGYSSLSNLRAFPFDKIKIDRSFVHGVDGNDQAATIVRAVVGLGRGLGLPLLAEGVETTAELAFLNAEACQEAQGYLLGRPEPIERFASLVRPQPAVAATLPAQTEAQAA